MSEQHKMTEKINKATTKETILSYLAFVLIFCIVGLIYVNYINVSQPLNATPVTENFMKCFISKEPVMYGTSWCHYCQQQKAFFSPKFNQIRFIDCDINVDACTSRGISSYPTWIVNGTTYVGLQSLEKLSEITGCKIK